MPREKRQVTGIHGYFKDPLQLEKWLKDFNPIQVQINFANKMYRGVIANYTVKAYSNTGYVSVEFGRVYTAEYPVKSNNSIEWCKLKEHLFYLVDRTKRVRHNFKWVYKECDVMSTPISMEILYSSYYITRENRIKVKGNGEHWRFFKSDDRTNLIETDGIVTQVETII